MWVERDVKMVWTKTFNLYLRCVWIRIHSELEMDEQDLQGGEVDDRIPILQLDPGVQKTKQNPDRNRERWF